MSSCLLCESPLRPTVIPAVSHNPSTAVHFAECSQCRTWSSHDAAARAQELYQNRDSANYDQKKGKALLAVKRWLLRRGYVAVLDRYDVKRVIDYGCGSGDLANSLLVPGRSVIAVDLQADRPPTLSPGVEYRQGGSSLVLDHSADRTAIVLRHVLEHIVEPADVLAQLASILGKSDILILEFPSVNSAFCHWMGQYWPGYYPPFHATLLDDAEVARVADGLGLQLAERNRREPPMIAGYISQRYGRISNIVRMFGLLLYPFQRIASFATGHEEAIELVFVKR